ncbi:DUF6524 family protein [Methylomagnum ishizawai]|uniref:DUF6524 family protein n=1 Tax=Methylomagnum ishizawai TaxID=1760988 RepID=UPI001C3220E2|nr:DUF6524 family protein [Methylomagnum ishizawai]BBL73434.1 hypothetical protein MishRS11D_05320 [Methylomagnum ishizawai]
MFGFTLRFLAALVLVFATWNPSPWNYVRWATATGWGAPEAFAGVVLLIGWVLFLHATLESLGFLGIALAGAFLGSLAWLLFDLGWLSAQGEAMAYVALVLIAAVLAIGMSWAHIWRRMSGQVEVDEGHDHG